MFPVDTVSQYFKGLEMIEAQEALLNIQVTSFPKLKDSARDKLHRQLHSRGYPKDDVPKAMTTKDMAEYMRNFGG